MNNPVSDKILPKIQRNALIKIRLKHHCVFKNSALLLNLAGQNSLI